MTQVLRARMAKIIELQLAMVERTLERQFNQKSPTFYVMVGVLGAVAIILAPAVIKHFLP